MEVSFIIPAHNEESTLPQTLERLFLTARECVGDGNFEIIVVDDASTDRTATIARRAGAKIVSVQHRQIAATRNSGAQHASGKVFAFVDADTLVPEATMRAVLFELQRGAIAGGAIVAFDDVSLLARLLTAKLMFVFRLLNLAAGCFMYCTREAFEHAGGFDTRFFASEEIWLSKALKAQGRFVLVEPPVITSGRKVRMYGLGRLFWISILLGIRGTSALQKREGLEVWYDGRRE